MSGFLYSGLGFGEWLLSVAGQTVVGFLLIGAILSPLWGKLRRFYVKQLDPYSPGGAGNQPAPNGEPMHEYLAERARP